MAGRKKKNGKKKGKLIPAKILGAKFQREKTSISSSTCERKAGKRGISSFPAGFLVGISSFPRDFSGFYSTGTNFPEETSRWRSRDFFLFFGNILGNAGKFQSGWKSRKCCGWKREPPEKKRDRNLREPRIYPGFPYSRRIPGKSRGEKKGIWGDFGNFFPIGKRGRRREKGEKKQSLAPGSLPAIPKVFLVRLFFWSHPLGIPGGFFLAKTSWKENSTDLK